MIFKNYPFIANKIRLGCSKDQAQNRVLIDVHSLPCFPSHSSTPAESRMMGEGQGYLQHLQERSGCFFMGPHVNRRREEERFLLQDIPLAHVGSSMEQERYLCHPLPRTSVEGFAVKAVTEFTLNLQDHW